MLNVLLLATHVSLLAAITMLVLRVGKDAAIAWLSLLAICMNLFVLKQITLFGLEVTSSEGLAVGYLLGFNLLQEFFGRAAAKKAVWISMGMSAAFVALSQFQLFYSPSGYDFMAPHYFSLLSIMPRLLIASLISFFVVQYFDLTFFAFLRKKWSGKNLVLRTLICLVASQAIDTVLFSYLGLYGVVQKISHVIVMSFFIKLFVIMISLPFVTFAKKIVRYDEVQV